ncbi:MULTISPECIES: YdcF family protein [unclassified Amycolatopsis]|uniref:YdcF family protein n=1 Tax=unclassified Amycolatopsis TaxID=2618356 RepID=UPI0003A470F1|nr:MULTISPECIES: YdcF family protein [unclassified Amycolatopsis]
MARRFLMLFVVVFSWAEWEHWRSSRRGMGDRPGTSGTGEAVVVLGYRNRGSRANFVNRWRVRAAVRSQAPGPSRLVLCGGAVGGTETEAALMARYAREYGYRGELMLETESRSTRENVLGAVPLIEDADRIKIVSDSLHAEKARHYLRRHRPDLAERLVPGRDYRFGEWLAVKPVLAVMGKRSLRRTRG